VGLVALASPAQAATIGVAQTSGMQCGGNTTFVDTASTVPGDGVIRSFSYASVSGNRNQRLNFKIFRPTSTPHVYTVHGATGMVTLQGTTGKERFALASPIVVQAGDKLGYHAETALMGCATTDASDGTTARYRLDQADVQVGATQMVDWCCYGRANVEADFDPDTDGDGVYDSRDAYPTIKPYSTQVTIGQLPTCVNRLASGAIESFYVTASGLVPDLGYTVWAERLPGPQNPYDVAGVYGGDFARSSTWGFLLRFGGWVPANQQSVFVKVRTEPWWMNIILAEKEVAVCQDADSDGIRDAADNCPSDSNADQKDLDADGKGDACDPDIDGDGVANAGDAFPRDPAESKDSDGDRVGDNADAFDNDPTESKDTDGDGVGDNADAFDNDPTETKDTDGDTVGDNADAFPNDATESKDADRDGKGDKSDNCPTDANADQKDLDGDGKGDACDGDIDGDGYANGDDAFDRDKLEWKDSDGDLIGDNSDRFPNDATEQTDADDDGKGDRIDNCKTTPNPDQRDTDGDGKGDVCDDDVEGDGVIDTGDNCPTVSNHDQADLDGDLTGDACDGDRDGDDVANGADVFPDDGGEWADSDGDRVGDNADAFPNDPKETQDTDRDHTGDNADNCVAVANEDQADLDGDKRGDACDGDIDGDGVANGDDRFPRDKAESKDSDGDLIGDNADKFPYDAKETVDADGDGIGDNGDNCRTTSNAGQADLDKDGQGDACDADDDGDTVPDATDNAPRTPNADQQDLDGDGIGDVIDRTVLPRNADMCKKDGWKRFYDGSGRFKNQGDCVSFVATGGKNLPAGS
jgi:hypothetical protein